MSDPTPDEKNKWWAWYGSAKLGGALDMVVIWNLEADVPSIADPEIQPTVKERDYILDAMADKPGIRDKVQSEGFYVNNVRYIFIRVDEQRLFGKMNQDGVLCYKFDDHLILGHHIEGTPTVAAAWQLESFSDKLQIAIRAAAGK